MPKSGKSVKSAKHVSKCEEKHEKSKHQKKEKCSDDCSEKCSEQCPNRQINRYEPYFVTQEVEIGYPVGRDPVPITHCLDNQIPVGNIRLFMGAVVEPTLAVNPVNPCNIVAAWQNGRFGGGGSLELGIAYTFDAGKTWNHTTIPTQICIGGMFNRASDPWLAWSADGKAVYFSTLLLTAITNPNQTSGIGVFKSVDGGMTWGDPIIVGPTNFSNGCNCADTEPFPDKNSITAHPTNPNFAYQVWETFVPFTSFKANTFFSQTFDQGQTWTEQKVIYDVFLDPGVVTNNIPEDNQTVDNIILVLPRCVDRSRGARWGDLLNFMVRIYATPSATDTQYKTDFWPYRFTQFDYAVIRSQDNGATWSQQAVVIFPSFPPLFSPQIFTGGYRYNASGAVIGGLGAAVRSGQFTPNPGINLKNGYLYAIQQSGAYRPDFLSQIELSTSRDGGFTWSTPVRVNRTPQDAPNPQAFTPAATATCNGYVGIIYSDFRNPSNPVVGNPNTVYVTTLTDTWLAIYKELDDPTGGDTGIGLQFIKEMRLSSSSYVMENGPFSSLPEFMTNGDYSFIVAHEDKFYVIYIESFNAPANGFAPAVIYYINPQTGGILRIDDNRRTAPYFSVIATPEKFCSRDYDGIGIDSSLTAPRGLNSNVEKPLAVEKSITNDVEDADSEIKKFTAQ